MAENETGQNLHVSPRYWPMWLGIALWRSLSWLPYPVALALGRGIGASLGRLSPSRRRITRRNIALCFPELGKRQQKRLVNRHFRSLGAALPETAIAWWGSRRRVCDLFRLEGLDHLAPYIEQGRGVILLTGHFTMLELSGRALAEALPRVAGVVRRHHNPLYEDTVQRGRSVSATTVGRHDTREMIRLLRGGTLLWYAPDQNYRGRQSAVVPFFNHPAPTTTATSRLARLGRAVVVPCLPCRAPGRPGYLIRILPALADFPSADPVADTARVNRLLEDWIREYPEQYLWVHRRFKPAGDDQQDPYLDRAAG